MILLLQRLISQHISKLEANIEEKLNKIEAKHLNSLKDNLSKMEPNRSFNSIIKEIEEKFGIRCLSFDQSNETIKIKVCFENNENSRKKILTTLITYPFLQGKIEKEIIDLKKLRYF